MTQNRQRPRVRQMLMTTLVLTWALASALPALAGSVVATGQTTVYGADKNDGIGGAVDVPDDGTLQRGAELKYTDTGKGTIKDARTGLEWEKKCSGCGGLHDVINTYRWSGNGSQETIWDWIEDVNAENGGKGYANHHDWRIPNKKELESIVNAELVSPSLDPLFGPTGVSSSYWSVTTYAFSPANAWFVDYFDGSVSVVGKSDLLFVRAVRGGSK